MSILQHLRMVKREVQGAFPAAAFGVFLLQLLSQCLFSPVSGFDTPSCDIISVVYKREAVREILYPFEFVGKLCWRSVSVEVRCLD